MNAVEGIHQQKCVLVYREEMGSREYNVLIYDGGHGSTSLGGYDGFKEVAYALDAAKREAKRKNLPLLISPELLDNLPEFVYHLVSSRPPLPRDPDGATRPGGD